VTQNPKLQSLRSEIGDDWVAEGRPEDRADQARHEKPAHRRNEIGPIDAAKQHEAADWDHHRAACALQQPREDEQGKIVRLRARDGAEGEDDDRLENTVGAPNRSAIWPLESAPQDSTGRT
jgi:hypothetical protein